MRRKVRISLGLIILAISIPLFVWGFWPVPRETRIRPVSFPSGLVLPEKRIITLTYPPRIRAGDVDVVRLTLGVDKIGTLAPTAESGAANSPGSGPPTIYDTHNVIAEARFDIPGMNVRPSDLISAPIVQGQTAVFYWTLRPRATGQFRGTIWLYLRAVDKLTGAESRETVSAQLVEIESIKLLGLPLNLVRIATLVGIALGILLCMPLFAALFGRFIRRQRVIT